MIIKPYYKWPKLSKLKVGDVIKIKEDGFKFYQQFNGKLVTITQIRPKRFLIKEIDPFSRWDWSRFEVINDL